MDDKIKNFRGAYSCFSNFYSCNGILIITEDGFEALQANNTESLYQALKSTDHLERKRIAAMSAGDSKKEGSRLRDAGLVRPDWQDVNLQYMEVLVQTKFETFPELADILVGTGDTYIEEGNYWHDRFYGCCYCGGNKVDYCSGDGSGENHLGKILMKVRERLRK